MISDGLTLHDFYYLADGNTDLAFEAWLKERDQKGEAATEQWNPSCVEPVFLGCTGFPVFTVGKRK